MMCHCPWHKSALQQRRQNDDQCQLDQREASPEADWAALDERAGAIVSERRVRPAHIFDQRGKRLGALG